MFRLFVGVLLLIVAIVAAVVRVVSKDAEDADVKTAASATAIISAVLGLVFLLLSTVRVVPPGNVGIPVLFGKTQPQVQSGVQFVNPLAKITKMSVRTEEYTMSVSHGEGDKKGDDSVSVKGADGATGHVDATLLYHLDKGSASTVYKELGTNYKDKILRPTARTCIRDGFTLFNMVDAATTARSKVDDSIRDCVVQNLEPRGIVLENFQLRDVQVEKSVQDAIDAKVAAQQNSQKKQFDLQTAAQDAEIKRVQASGIADAQQIVTCGANKETQTVNGKEVQVVVPKTGVACEHKLTPEYLQYLYIESLKDLVNSPNHSTLILPFDQKLTPLLNMNQAN